MSKLLKELKRQLEEKDKEIERLENELLKFAHRISDQNEEILKLKQQLAERQKKNNFKICRMCEQEFEQSQNQTAIKELNNILDTFAIFVNEEKESMVSPDGSGNLSLLEYIENHINTLKGEHKC